MDKEDELWQTAFIEFAERERSVLEDHPKDADLDLFSTKSLPAGQLEELRDHLAICPSCLSKVLDQKTFPLIGPPSNVLSLTDAQVEDRWQMLRGRLFTGPSSESHSAPLSRRRSVRRRTLGLTLAAMLAVAFVGVSFLRPQRVSTSTQVVSLVPDAAAPASITRGPEGVPTVLVSPSTDFVVLRLPVSFLEELPTYAIEIFEGDADTPRWQDSSIRRAEDFSFNVSFPRSALPQGNYRIQLWGQAGADRRLIARFHFRVQIQKG